MVLKSKGDLSEMDVQACLLTFNLLTRIEKYRGDNSSAFLSAKRLLVKEEYDNMSYFVWSSDRRRAVISINGRKIEHSRQFTASQAHSRLEVSILLKEVSRGRRDRASGVAYCFCFKRRHGTGNRACVTNYAQASD